MTEKIKRINNPLTIIAIFAALAEINATVAIGLIDSSLHEIFIWFVIGFPTLLVILFFITLNYNTKVMYSPSDYNDDKNFLDLLSGNNYGDKEKITNSMGEKLSVDLEKRISNNLSKKIDEIAKKSDNPELKSDIELIKNHIKSIADKSIEEVKKSYELPLDLKEKLINFSRFPAFYILIDVLIKSKSNSINKLRNASNRYFISEGWEEGGIQRLFEEDILIGDDEKFEINPLYKENLKKWISINNTTLKFISLNLKKKEDTNNDSEEFVRIENRIKSLSERLNF